jgi:uncharacterized membrane protein HdeD (DUF308 family)
MTLEEHIESQLKEGERKLARIWRTLAVSGLLGIGFGVVAVIWPGIGLTTLIAVFAGFALAIGLTTIIGAFDAAVPRRARFWIIFQGLLPIAAAVVVLVWPGLSARALLFAIAAWAVAAGTVEFLGGVLALPLSGARALLVMLAGLVSVAFGVIMFARPGAGALALLMLIAAFAIVTGVTQLAASFELRRVAHEAGRRVAPRATAKPVTHG